jgi:hypothetical protein
MATITGAGAYAFWGRSAARAINDVANNARAAVADPRMIFFIATVSRVGIDDQPILQFHSNSALLRSFEKAISQCFARKENGRDKADTRSDCVAQILRNLGDNLRKIGGSPIFRGLLHSVTSRWMFNVWQLPETVVAQWARTRLAFTHSILFLLYFDAHSFPHAFEDHINCLDDFELRVCLAVNN